MHCALVELKKDEQNIYQKQDKTSFVVIKAKIKETKKKLEVIPSGLMSDFWFIIELEDDDDW